MKNAPKKSLLAICLLSFFTTLSAQSLQNDYKKRLESNKKSQELDEVVTNLDRDAIKYQCDAHTLAFSRGAVFIKRENHWTKELYAPYELSKDYVSWSMRKPIGAYFTSVYFDFHFNSNQLYSKVMIVNEYGRDITPDFFQLWDLMGKQTPNVLDEHAKLTQCVLLPENNSLTYKVLNKFGFEGKTFTSLKELQRSLENDGYMELEQDFRVWQKGIETLVFTDSNQRVSALFTVSNPAAVQHYKKYKTVDQLVRFLEKEGWQENKYGIFMSRSDMEVINNKSVTTLKSIYIDLKANDAISKVVRLPDQPMIQISKNTAAE